MNIVRRKGSRLVAYVISVVVFVYVMVYMPTPYIIYSPGSADEIRPMVQVKQGDPAEKGNFMMTTVAASYANLSMLVLSAFNPNDQIEQKESRLRGKDEDEYAAEQVFLMSDSQSSAVEAAYEQAHVPYRIEPQYVFIYSIPKESEAKGILLPGDRLTAINAQAIHAHTELSSYLSSKKVGEEVTVSLIRDGRPVEKKIKLVAIKAEGDSGKTRAGLGVMIATMQKVVPQNAGKEVLFKSTQVGGPSAGLMFTMEIYNQLTPGDLTKGYQVAGTGTIDKTGKVGPIGGVQHKIVAADRKGAELFFVPRDNYAEAKAKADRIHTPMKLIPVDKVEDVIGYMNGLPAKS